MDLESINLYFAYTYITNVIKEKEASTLRVGCHGNTLRKGNSDGAGGGKGERHS